MIKKSVLFLLLISPFVGFQSLSQASDKDGLTSVLFIGNSYTHMNDMPFIFEKIARNKGQKVVVEMSAKSGANLKEQVGRADVYDKIRSRKWDYVVIQGFSREFGYAKETIDTATMPYLNQLLDSVRLNHPCTQPLFYMTWGYSTGLDYYEPMGSYEKMTNAISQGYMYISDLHNVPVVPVGRVWQSFRASNPKVEMYQEDQQHPTKTASYLVASSFYAAIFNESPSKNNTKLVSNAIDTGIDNAITRALMDNRERYKLNMNNIKLKTYNLADNKYLLVSEGRVSDGTSFLWEFKDGKNGYQMFEQHIYSKPGIYQIQLNVDSTCGTRVYTRRVKFTETPAPPAVAPPTPKPVKKGNTPVKKI